MINSESKNQAANTAWFTEVVEANLDVDFVIVGMHRSFYGSTYASDSVNVRNLWLKLFDRYGVDLVLSGHDHVYARSYKMYNNQISNDPIRGTTYIIGGSGGPKFYGAQPNPQYAKIVEQTACANIITIDQSKISINLVNAAGTSLDTYAIAKKRIGTVDENFTKETFLASITTSLVSKSSAKVTWPANGYHQVANMQVISKKYGFAVADTHLYNESFTDMTFTGILQNALNEYIIRVKFADGTTVDVDYV